MAEYISKAEAIEAIRQTYCPNCDSCNGIMCKACGYKDCMDIVDDVKAVDVQPVKQGQWIWDSEPELGNPYGSYRCSECGNRMKFMEIYCCGCGARMEEEGENETD